MIGLGVIAGLFLVANAGWIPVSIPPWLTGLFGDKPHDVWFPALIAGWLASAVLVAALVLWSMFYVWRRRQYESLDRPARARAREAAQPAVHRARAARGSARDAEHASGARDERARRRRRPTAMSLLLAAAWLGVFRPAAKLEPSETRAVVGRAGEVIVLNPSDGSAGADRRRRDRPAAHRDERRRDDRPTTRSRCRCSRSIAARAPMRCCCSRAATVVRFVTPTAADEKAIKAVLIKDDVFSGREAVAERARARCDRHRWRRQGRLRRHLRLQRVGRRPVPEPRFVLPRAHRRRLERAAMSDVAADLRRLAELVDAGAPKRRSHSRISSRRAASSRRRSRRRARTRGRRSREPGAPAAIARPRSTPRGA